MTPLLSLILPVYNAAEHLEKCLASIAAQTWGGFELIIVDDGSSDNSGSICDSFAARDARVKVVHKANAGVSSARNAALKLAEGEYIAFIDADDYLEPFAYEKLMEAALRNRAELLVYDYKKVDTKGSALKKLNRTAVLPLPSSETKWSGSEFCMRVISPSSEVAGYVWNKLFKKSLIEGLYFAEEYNICEDLLFTQQAAERAGEAFYIPESLYYYVDNLFGATRSSAGKAIQELQVRNEILLSVQKSFPDILNEALNDFTDISLRVIKSMRGDCEPLKKGRELLRKWLTKILRCKSIRFKIKTLYCLAAISPKLYLKHIK